MSTDVDQLLRDTLHARAATVHESPLPEVPARRAARPWLAAAAAAAAVLGLAGGIAYLVPSPDREPTASGGGLPTACRTTLPAAWRTALDDAPPLTAAGHTVSPEVITPQGLVLGTWVDDDRAQHTYLIDPDGSSRDLITTPADRSITGLDIDDRSAVISTTKAGENAPPPDDLIVVSLASGVARHILSKTPTPRGWVVATALHSAVIQDGNVYWGMRPAGPPDQVTQVDVVRYTVRTGTYAIVGHLSGDLSHDGTDEVDRDVRGVGWTGGSVPAKHVPTGLPGFRNAQGVYQFVASDGHAAAWDLGSGSSAIHWTDGAGDVRAFEIPQTYDPDNSVGVQAVSGPFVFFFLNSNKGGELVLDTRTGAFARTGRHIGTVLAADDRVVLDSQDGADSQISVLTTKDLPGLTC